MRVTKENNKRMALLGIANIILVFIIAAIRLNNLGLDVISYFVLHACAATVYILLLLYLINILQYAREKITVQTPFNIYLGLASIKLILSFLYTSAAETLTMGIGMLSVCITVYLFISSFKVANEKIASAYKLFSLIILLNMVIKIAIPFVVTISPHILPSRYFGFMDIIEGGAILHIIRRGGDLLEADDASAVNSDI